MKYLLNILCIRGCTERVDSVMTPESRDQPNHVVINGAVYAEVPPRRQRVQDETSASTSAAAANAMDHCAAVSTDFICYRGS